jgi:hypothetical protein
MMPIACPLLRRSLRRPRGPARLGAASIIIALSVGCTDNPTVPQHANGAGVFAIRPEEASVVVHRTTTSPNATDGSLVVKRQTLVQQIRTVAHSNERGAAVNIVRLADGELAELARQPVPLLSAPARHQSSACANAPRWTRTVPVPSLPGAIVVVTGQGDAPATRVELIRNGQPVAEMTRSWVRMSRSWELTRQEVRVAERDYRDVMEIERRPAPGEALQVAVPVFACIADDSASATRASDELDPFGRYRPVRSPSALEAPGAPREIEECIADGYDRCADKRDLKMAADIAYVSASLAVAFTCPTLAIVKAPECTKSLSGLGTAIAAVLAANHALERCIADQQAQQKACECAGGVAMEDRVSDARMTPRAYAWLAPGTLRSYMDCDGSDGSGGDSPVGDYPGNFAANIPDATGAGGVYVCEYEVDYDPETNSITVFPLYCYVQWLE